MVAHCCSGSEGTSPDLPTCLLHSIPMQSNFQHHIVLNTIQDTCNHLLASFDANAMSLKTPQMNLNKIVSYCLLALFNADAKQHHT